VREKKKGITMGLRISYKKKESKGENTVERCQVEQRGEGGTYTDTTRLPIPTPLSLPANPIAIKLNQNSDSSIVSSFPHGKHSTFP